MTFDQIDLFQNPRILLEAGFPNMREFLRSKLLALHHIVIPSSRDLNLEFRGDDLLDSDTEYVANTDGIDPMMHTDFQRYYDKG